MKFNCDVCGKSIKLTPTVAHKVNIDGLLVYCKKCWTIKGLERDKYSGQIQDGIYLATN